MTLVTSACMFFAADVPEQRLGCGGGSAAGDHPRRARQPMSHHMSHIIGLIT
jgi:hypothetical protein